MFIRKDFAGLVQGEGREPFLDRYPDAEPLLAAGEIMLDAHHRADHFTTLLRRTLKLPMLSIPYVFQRRHGFAFTRALARAIEAER